MGYSMGGWISLNLLARFPSRVMKKGFYDVFPGD
jgi:hypothetical protein